MKIRTIAFYILSILLVTTLFSVPFYQLVEINHKETYVSNDENRIEITFGGPKITWVTVECNVTAEIHFMFQDGVWTATHNVLLVSILSKNARFNYNSEHPTTVVEIIGQEPFDVRITYTNLIPMEMSCFGRLLYSYDSIQLDGSICPILV